METTYGQDMDAFIEKYIPQDERAMATLYMQQIVIKAQKAFLAEVKKNANL